jgi:6-methylsalicylate decarboxylase
VVPNLNNITRDEMGEWLGGLWLDTAAAVPSALGPAVGVVGAGGVVYGVDCGAPCSTEETMEANRLEVWGYEGLSKEEREVIGRNVLV